jgi:prepilin-type N-terminal cleavage/methylation domain-containing protein
MVPPLNKQDGLTLIELLASLAILGFLLTLIYGIFINGINYSTKAKAVVMIQQEANILLTSLKEEQQNEKSYQLSVKKDPTKDRYYIEINTLNESGVTINTITINNPKYSYQLFDESNNLISSRKFINTTTEDFYVKVILTSVNNPNNTYKVETILSRL